MTDTALTGKALTEQALARTAPSLSTIVLSTIVLSTLFLSTAAYAETKIAFVNVGRAFDEYDKTKRLDKELEARTNAKQQEREQKVAAIKKMREELDLLSEQGRQERQSTIDTQIRELQEFDQAARESLRRERDAMLKGVLDEIEKIVQAYAAREGYQVVLTDRAVLYADPSTDITEAVIAVLNQPERGKKP